MHHNSVERTSKHSRQIGRALLLAGTLLLSLFVAAVSVRSLATADVTVCTAGAPACDFATIQEGIDAAATGGRVLVEPGVYHEQVGLRSGIVLSSTAGMTQTVIRSADGPVVSATNVTSTVLQGFTIRGQGEMTVAVGLASANSQLALIDTTVEVIQGRDNMAPEAGSADAFGIRASGGGALALARVIIHDIFGGSDSDWLGLTPEFDAGDAVGVEASGTLTLTIVDANISELLAGDAGYDEMGCLPGAETAGVRTRGAVALTLQDSEIEELASGNCEGSVPWCPGYLVGGLVAGVDARGGQVAVSGSRLADFIIRADQGSARAVLASGVTTASLTGNTIAGLPAATAAGQSAVPQAAQAPCPLGGHDIVAVEIAGGGALAATENDISQLVAGVWTGRGASVGLKGSDVTTATIAGNRIADLRGPAASPAVAIWLGNVASAQVSRNQIGLIQGGDAPPYIFPTDGGSATGLSVAGSQALLVENNIIHDVSGGAANSDFAEGAGGAALAQRVENSSAHIFHNTVQGTAGGQGAGGGEPGLAVGLWLVDSDGAVTNNALLGHGVAISVGVGAGRQPVLDYQGLWHNEADYVGATAGAHDVVTAPALAGMGSEGWRLTRDSPYVDAGTNAAATPVDYDGDSRPLDGNGDGVAVADIGADEYWSGLSGSSKWGVPFVISPGGRISYTIALTNASQGQALASVLVSDSLPLATHLVSGTLTATAGVAIYHSGLVTWTGELPAGGEVAIRFVVDVDAPPEGALAVVNQAFVDDRLGSPWPMRAVNFVNPYRQFLPVVPGEE